MESPSSDEAELQPQSEEIDPSLMAIATEDNKKLNELIRRREADLFKKKEELTLLTDRLSIIKEHTKNVNQELIHSQQLIDAENSEKKTENHLNSLSEREVSRFRSELREFDKEILNNADRFSAVQNEIYKGNERLETFQIQQKFSKEQLEEWMVAAKQKSEDATALEKYKYQDDARIKSLIQIIEKKTNLVTNASSSLENEVTETQSAQIELDRTAEEFRRLHQERQQLIRQWDEAVEKMNQRDKEISEMAQLVLDARHEVDHHKEIVKEHAEMLKAEQGLLQGSNNKISKATRMAEKQRVILAALISEENELTHAFDVKKVELQKLESDIRASAINNRNLQDLIREKQQQVVNANARFEAAKVELKELNDVTQSKEERTKKADALLSKRQAELKANNRQIDLLKEQLFKKSQALYQLKQREISLDSDINGSHATGRTLQAKIHDLNQFSLKQQETLYNIEFQVQTLERKVARAGGKRTQEEQKALNLRIGVLKGNLEKQNQLHSTLTSQFKKLQDDKRAGIRNVERSTAIRKELEQKIGELNLEIASIERELEKMKKQGEDLAVQHDLLSLSVKKQRDTLANQTDAVYALKSQQFELEIAMKAKKEEIELQHDILRMESKSAREEKHAIQHEYNERLLKIESLKSKFATIAGTTAASLNTSDVDGKSQASFVIAAAQEREDLQREGDQLNEETKATLKQTKALQNTLAAVKNCNSAFENTQKAVDRNSPEAILKDKLTTESKSVASLLYQTQQKVSETKSECEAGRKALAQLATNTQHLQSAITVARKDISDLDNAIELQNQQIQRAQHGLAKVVTQIRNQNETETVPEMDIRMQETRSRNRTLLNILQNFVEQNPDLDATCKECMADIGLSFPSTRPDSSLSQRSTTSSIRNVLSRK